jgi:HNH endonuclease
LLASRALGTTSPLSSVVEHTLHTRGAEGSNPSAGIIFSTSQENMKRIPKLHFILINRFISNVDQSGGLNSCWPWQGIIGPTGYGIFTINGKNYKAHRVSYLLANGRIDDNLLVLHTCDFRSCVNPKHLHQGTAKDNSQDAVHKKRNTKVFGEQNGNHKLTQRQVKAIRMMYGDRLASQKAIAKAFGVCEATISYIVRGYRWKKNI